MPEMENTDSQKKDASSVSINIAKEEKSDLDTILKIDTDESPELDTLVEEETLCRALQLPFDPLWCTFLTFICYVDCLVMYYSFLFSNGLPESFRPFHLFVDICLFIHVFLISTYKLLLKYEYIDHDFEASSWKLLAIDAITLIPWRLFLRPYRINLIKFARFIRLFLYFQGSRQLIANSILQCFIEISFHLCTLVLIYIIIISLILQEVIVRNFKHWKNTLNRTFVMQIDPNENWFLFCWYMAMCHVTLNGLELNFDYSEFEHVVLTAMVSFSYLWVFGFHLGQFTKVVQNKMLSCFLYYKFIYLYDHYLTTTTNVSKKVKMKYITYFKVLWKEHRGVSTLETFKILLPDVLLQELSLEIYWDSFRHSHILRKMDIPFLRYIALYMESRYMMPGEYIYIKNYEKNQFVYVVSGVVQVLANEGDHVPMMSFSSGTSFGLCSLVLPHIARKSLQCKTTCVIHLIQHSEFNKMAKIFPKQYCHIRKTIYSRYAKAKNHYEMTKNIDIENPFNFSKEVLTLRWFLYINKQLLEYELPGHYIFEHKYRELEYWNRLVFIGPYINDVASAEDRVLVNDSVFLRQKCPCIFQPYSRIIQFWHMCINMIIVVAIFVMPYNIAFTDEKSNWYSNFTFTITILWLFDLYVQCSTAVVLEDVIISDMLRIFLYRLSHFEFLIDIISCVPIEVFSYFYFPHLSPQANMGLQINRLFKTWQLEKMFDDIEDGLSVNITLVRTIKSIIYSFVFLYGLSVCLYLFNCHWIDCKVEYWQQFSYDTTGEQRNIIKFLYFTSNILTGTTIILGNIFTPLQFLDRIFLMAVSKLYYIYMIAQISASSVLIYYSWVAYMETVINLKTCMAKNHFHKLIYQRIWTFLYFSYEISKGIRLRTFPIRNINIEQTIRQDIYEDILETQPLFSGLSKPFMKQICKHSSRLYVPENEVVIYTGQTCRAIMIIFSGHCEMIASSSELKNRLLKTGDSIALLECLLNIPSIHTYVSSTTLILLTISVHDFKENVLSLFPEESYPIRNAILYANKILERKYILTPSLPINIYDYHDKKHESRVHFDFETGTVEYELFNAPYEISKTMYLLKNLLMQSTILPEGNFAFYWEVSRCFFAILSVFSFSNPLLVFASTGTWSSWYLTFLDIMAYIDIYIQLHMCYYDEKGILLTHPIKTASYYVTHRFCLDLISCFKFEFLFYRLARTSQLYWIACKMNRLLQIHRVFGLLSYHKVAVFSHFIVFYCFYGHLMLLTSIAFVSSLALTSNCIFYPNSTQKSDESTFSDGIICKEGTWITLSKFRKPLTPTRVYLYFVYFITSLITSSALQTFEVHNDSEAILDITITYLGFLYFIFNISLIVAGVTAQSKQFLRYKDEINSLLKFMQIEKLNKEIQANVMKHFQLHWNRDRGRTPCELYKVFNDTLRDDLLFATYHKVFKDSSIFESAPDGCIHKVLAQVENELIINEGFVLRINDVHSIMYILVKGTVEVYGPANTHFATLYPGSIFGNLDNTVEIRQVITVIANGHVDVLKIKSTEFHHILKHYSEFQLTFDTLISYRFDFISNLNAKPPNDTQEQEADEELEPSKSGKKKKRKQRIIDPHSRLYIVWNNFFIFGVCFLTFCQDLYQLHIRYQTSLVIIIWSYLSDIFFLIHMYVKSCLAYENEYGILITQNIRKRYKKSFAFKFDVFTVIPFELLTIIIARELNIIFLLGRLNKLLRIIYFARFILLTEHNLTFTYMRHQLSNFVLWPVLMIHVITCTLTGFISMNDVSTGDNYDKNKLFKLYVYHFRSLLTLLFSASVDEHYPHTVEAVMFFITIMVCFRVLSTIFIADISINIKSAHLLEFKYREKINRFFEFLKLNNVGYILRNRAVNHVYLTWGVNRLLQFPHILKHAPYYLRESVMLEVYGSHIINSTIFRNCHPDFLRQVIPSLHPALFFVDDYVTFEDSVNNSLFIIHDGQVEELSVDGTTEYRNRILHKDEIFGIECGLNIRFKQKFTYRCLESSLILTLNFEEWKHLLTYYPASRSTIDENLKKIL